MCVAVPMQVVSIDGEIAVTEIDGVRREASLMLLAEEVAVGDFVIVHAGFALHKIDEHEAMESLKVLRQMASLMDTDPS